MDSSHAGFACSVQRNAEAAPRWNGRRTSFGALSDAAQRSPCPGKDGWSGSVVKLFRQGCPSDEEAHEIGLARHVRLTKKGRQVCLHGA